MKWWLAPTTVDHKEASVVESKMVTEGEETVVEEMVSEEAKVVVAEEEVLALLIRLPVPVTKSIKMLD